LLCAVFAAQSSARNQAHARALQIAAQAQRDLLRWEQTARQAAEEANRAKDEFLAVVSHELRTPLNALAGWTRMLRSGRLDPAATARALLMVERNTQTQIRLTEDLLDFASLHAHQVRLRKETVVVSDLVAAALSNAQMEALAQGVTLTADTAPQAGVMAADPSRLQQILSNLLTNAIKFTPSGGAVTLAATRAGDFILFTIRDTGQGITPEFLPHVFERFRQEEVASARQHGGLGLGLAIVSQLVALHGGSVTATSGGFGQGACFVVRLPASSAQQQEP
jgi:signal transduction histidine kinase